MPDGSHLDANGFVILDDPQAARAQEIAHCGLCDDDGYHGSTVCDHQAHSTVEGRQAAREILQAALTKGGKQ